MSRRINPPEAGVRLSMVNQNKGIKLHQHVASPGCHCPMHASFAIFRQLKGISTLVVGTPECTYYSRFVIDHTFNNDEQKHYSYVLDANEVVFGCSEGVEEALQTMISEGAKQILVLMTCIPALIGEDFDALLDIDESVTIQVIDVAHFKRNGYLSGSHLTSEVICRFITPLEKDKNQVNVWGAIDHSEESLYLIEVLEEKGFLVEVFDGTGHIRDYDKASKGTLNIVLSYGLFGIEKGLSDSPSVLLFDVYDIKTMQARYDVIGEFCGIPQLGQQMKEKFGGQLLEKAWVTDKISSKYKTYITSADTVTLSLAYALSHYGVIPEWVHIEEMDQVQLSWRGKLLERGMDPYVLYLGTKLIDEEGPLLVFGEGISDEFGLYNKDYFKENTDEAIAQPRRWWMALQQKIGFERILMLEDKLLEQGVITSESQVDLEGGH